MKKNNKIDLLALIFLALMALTIVTIIWSRPRDLGQKSFIKVEVKENIEIIRPAIKTGETVFLNGQKNQSKLAAVNEVNGKLEITLEGLGQKKHEVYLFNGSRILVGQKAELHGSFWAQGIVKEVSIP